MQKERRTLIPREDYKQEKIVKSTLFFQLFDGNQGSAINSLEKEGGGVGRNRKNVKKSKDFNV